MIDFVKSQIIGIVALVGVVVMVFAGGEGDMLGAAGTTITNPWTFDEPTGTTTLTVQSSAASKGACLALEMNDGSGLAYFSVDSAGNWATSSATCD